MEKCEIIRLFPDKEEKLSDSVTEEIPFTIHVNNEEIVTLLASPTELEDLAVGFLLTSGFVKDYEEIEGMTLDDQCWIIYVELKKNIELQKTQQKLFTSGCGRGTLFHDSSDLRPIKKQKSKMTIKRDRVYQLMKDFQICSLEFSETGGVHSAALVDNESIMIIREDIGRHNAIDKILGWALRGHVDLNDKIILSSGRISSEIILKTQKTPIPIIISRSAPTNNAVKHAQYTGVTLIGFARGRKMNVYSGRERIV